jgi:hypothetical protein
MLAVKFLFTCNSLKLTGDYINFSQSQLKFGLSLLHTQLETASELGLHDSPMR